MLSSVAATTLFPVFVLKAPKKTIRVLHFCSCACCFGADPVLTAHSSDSPSASTQTHLPQDKVRRSNFDHVEINASHTSAFFPTPALQLPLASQASSSRETLTSTSCGSPTSRVRRCIARMSGNLLILRRRALPHLIRLRILPPQTVQMMLLSSDAHA